MKTSDFQNHRSLNRVMKWKVLVLPLLKKEEEEEEEEALKKLTSPFKQCHTA